MKKISGSYFYTKLQNKAVSFPLRGLIELTYQCDLNCLHCYCKGSELGDEELKTAEWIKLLDEISHQGCLYLTFSGGEPLLRKDFCELYAYAKSKGFIITIFTNGQNLSSQCINLFKDKPPYCVEVTLNGITKYTYERITQTEGAFRKAMNNISKIRKNNIKLVIKANWIKYNRDELHRIKKLADVLLGAKKDRYHFKYDPIIYPRLNGDRAPRKCRLSFDEIWNLAREDKDIWRQLLNRMSGGVPKPPRDVRYLYRCSAWMQSFFINPYGRLKFCNFSDKFSVDLRKTEFRYGFYQVFPRLLDERFKTNSKCRNCRLRPLCYNCPARAYLETGDEEAPVEYYCKLAEATKRRMDLLAKSKSSSAKLLSSEVAQ